MKFKPPHSHHVVRVRQPTRGTNCVYSFRIVFSIYKLQHITHNLSVVFYLLSLEKPSEESDTGSESRFEFINANDLSDTESSSPFEVVTSHDPIKSGPEPNTEVWIYPHSSVYHFGPTCGGKLANDPSTPTTVAEAKKQNKRACRKSNCLSLGPHQQSIQVWTYPTSSVYHFDPLCSARLGNAPSTPTTMVDAKNLHRRLCRKGICLSIARSLAKSRGSDG